jgi:hypothetical protein
VLKRNRRTRPRRGGSRSSRRTRSPGRSRASASTSRSTSCRTARAAAPTSSRSPTGSTCSTSTCSPRSSACGSSPRSCGTSRSRTARPRDRRALARSARRRAAPCSAQRERDARGAGAGAQRDRSHRDREAPHDPHCRLARHADLLVRLAGQQPRDDRGPERRRDENAGGAPEGIRRPAEPIVRFGIERSAAANRSCSRTSPREVRRHDAGDRREGHHARRRTRSRRSSPASTRR